MVINKYCNVQDADFRYLIHVHVYACECLKLSIIMLIFYRLIPGFGIVQ